MKRRRWPWILALIVLLLVAKVVYDSRPRATAAEQAAAYEAKLAADPATAPGETALNGAMQALLAVTAAPDLILQDHQRWSEDRVPDGIANLPDVPSAPERAAALLRQAGFWRVAMAKRPSGDDLAGSCVYQVPYASCTVQASGEVPGSQGMLRYQAAGRFLVASSDSVDQAAARSDPMVGATIDVFAPDAAGGWRMVLATTGRLPDLPDQVMSPVGPLLLLPDGALEQRRLYAVVNGTWRYLYQGAWIDALAARAPPGSCLEGGFYLGRWPWPKQMIEELSRLPLDVANFTVDSAYVADGGRVAQVHAQLGLDGQELVLRSADVKHLASASLWARAFGGCSSRAL